MFLSFFLPLFVTYYNVIIMCWWSGHVELEQKRPPINLAIVLDRSGSMESHKKLHNAKEAIIKVIEQLGHQDVLHLVLYGFGLAHFLFLFQDMPS